MNNNRVCNSHDLETLIKSVSTDVYNKCKSNGVGNRLELKTKIEKKDIPYGTMGFMPDGYVWLIDGIPELAIECKEQNSPGTAIERWYKNNYIARLINPTITYLTFASGLGCMFDGTIYKTLYPAHKGKYNVIRLRENMAYLSCKGHTYSEVYSIIYQTVTLLLGM